VFPARVFRYQSIVIARMDRVRPLPREMPRVTVRLARPDDEPALQAVHPDPAGYAGKFEAGWIFALAFRDGEPAAFTGYIPEDWHVSQANAFRIRIGDDGCFAQQAEVAPKFRGSGILFKLWVEAKRLLSEQGYDRIWATFAHDNPLSLRSHTRLGFEPVWEYRVLRLAGLIRHDVRDAANGATRVARGWGWWRSE
jgi:GNAT superfamily N-acetyltransferase